MRRRLAAIVLFTFLLPAYGQSAVAPFAPAQLRLAQSELAGAQAALTEHDYEQARRLAALAGLDARLAWGMTDSQFLRRDAAQVHEQSARLRWLAQEHAGVPLVKID